MNHPWSNTLIHPHKRALSLAEKRTYTGPRGFAACMPGVPDTEVEELRSIGFLPHQITAIEQDEAKADALLVHYADQVPIYLSPALTFFERSKRLYDYVHLDFCNRIDTKDNLATIETAAWHLTDAARMRVTLCASRKPTPVLRRESEHATMLFAQLLRAVFDTDFLGHASVLPRGERETWHRMAGEFSPFLTPDAPLITAVLSVIFANVLSVPSRYVNESSDWYPDELGRGAPAVGMVAAYRYKEPASTDLMHTMWVDFVPALTPCQTIVTLRTALERLTNIDNIIYEDLHGFSVMDALWRF